MKARTKEEMREYQQERRRLKVLQIKGVTEDLAKGVTDNPEPYVIPMTRKAAIEICKAVAARGDGAPLTGDVKRRAFSALHNVHDCRYIEI